MAEKSEGPSTMMIIVIAVLVTPVVLAIIFLLIGGGSADAKANLPDVTGKGLQWAQAQTKDAGFGNLQSHDALGRNRRWSDDKDWEVCFESPAPGNEATSVHVQLGVVKIGERCPVSDQALYVKAVSVMPDLTNRTVYMAGKILGDNASVRYLNRSNGDSVSGGSGDWRVCAQAPKAGQRFDGVPVTALVIPYDKRC